MNRETRRRLGAHHVRGPVCNDCTADGYMWIDSCGVGHLEIEHDDTCPMLRKVSA